MTKKLLNCALVIFTFVTLFCTVVYAESSVTVEIAPYKTQISDMSVYNYAVEYPIITYRNIAYIPMTYNLCKKLDMQTGFDENKGLYIIKNHESYPTAHVENCFGRTDLVNFPGAVYTAYLPEYPVYLNGIRIDNEKEEYPILNFRGITYFPLTYRFCEYDLKLALSFSETDGLVVVKHNEVNFGGMLQGNAYVGYFAEDVKGSGNIELVVDKTGLETYVDEFGTERGYFYQWWEKYTLFQSENGDSLEKTATFTSYSDYPSPPEDGKKQFAVSDRFTESNKKVFYQKTQIADFTDHYPIVSLEGSEYLADNGITFLCLDVMLDDMPQRVPYDPMHEERLYVMDRDGIRRLEGWDKYSKLENAVPDGCGGYYLYSEGYYPGGYSRWLVPDRCVFRYTASGDFYEVTVPDTNDTEMIGVYGTRLYVKAMYNANDNGFYGGDVSTVNSGFYEIDILSGETKMLCPYFVGNAFLASNGTLYGITSYSVHPRIINLHTMQIMQID